MHYLILRVRQIIMQCNIDSDQGPDGSIWVLSRGQMGHVPVHQLVSTEWDEQKQQFSLALVEDQLTALIKARGSAFNRNEKIHTITIYGRDAKCGKAFAMNSAGTASLADLSKNADESLFNFGFEAMCVYTDKARYGLYVSEPFKRYGRWYMVMMVRVAQTNDKGVIQRLRSLAIRLSTCAIFMTQGDSFVSGAQENAASAMGVVTVEFCSDDRMMSY